MVTLAIAKRFLRSIDVGLRKPAGYEYEVALIDDDTGRAHWGEAYYTPDLDDAIGTGISSRRQIHADDFHKAVADFTNAHPRSTWSGYHGRRGRTS